jgi:cell division protein FtsA
MVGLEIKRSGFGGMTPSGIVLTGGGAQTVGAIDAAKRNLAMPVHIGETPHVTGLIDEIQSPSYAASIGLLQYGVKQDSEESNDLFGGFSRAAERVPLKGIAGKVADLLKSLLP